jgi:hypothetical protein
MRFKIVGLFARRISEKKVAVLANRRGENLRAGAESVALVRLRIHFSLASARAAQARLSSVDVGGARHC